ncbi:MAG: MmcB family DNA repair protein [Firmicutes bacterium]|nr:MmcB family DNA repair protein [Bacillota bacterium]
MKWKHNELAEDLSFSIGSTPYLDVNLGSAWLNRGSQRADIVGIKPSYTRFCLSIYEIKVSRADFLSDIRKEKWKGYLDHCHRFYFAVPSGLVSKDEIPEPAGLMVRGEKGWTTVKAAKVLDNDIPKETLQSILFARVRDSEQEKHFKEVYHCIHSKRGKYIEYKEAKKAFGKKVADALQNFKDYKSAKLSYEHSVDRINKDVAEILDEVREVLGMPKNNDSWYFDIKNKLRKMQSKAN